jgi:N-acetyl-anhydromuramyl-L-alanine amidase AmpD
MGSAATTHEREAVDISFIESPNRTRTEGRKIDLVVIHTMEITEHSGAAESCAEWFATTRSQVSAHYCVDADSVVQCVREQDIAWHARGGNKTSIGIELAGHAGQGPRGWDDAYSWSVLMLGAALTADICTRYAIPIRWLRAPDLRARRSGITGHGDVSTAFKRSDHWDPGPAFPVKRFLGLVRAAAANRTAADPVSFL